MLKALKLRKKDSEKRPSAKEWPDHIVTLNEDTFPDFIRKYPLSVVDFWASWCAPCKVILPRLRLLSKKYEGRVAFGRLNVEKNEDIATRYRIRGIPHLIFFSYGKKVLSITGVRTVGDLTRSVDRMLAKYGK